MKKLFLLLLTTLSLSVSGQHPLLEKMLEADTNSIFTNIYELNLKTDKMHMFFLGNETEQRWLNHFDFNETSNVFTWKNITDKHSWENLEIKQPLNDNKWAYIIKIKSKLEIDYLIEIHISKGGNIVAEKFYYDSGAVCWRWHINSIAFSHI